MIRKLLLFLCLWVHIANAQPWQAKWISCKKNNTATGSFFAYRKQVTINQVPARAIARIAVDSKYWLWVNDKLVVREGGLKRGPNPDDTYYDEVNIAPYLSPGANTIAVMVWFFGKDGFSHKNSGISALLFDCQEPNATILSDASWQCSYLDAYQPAPAPLANFRLAEPDIRYDAGKDIGKWQSDLSIPLDQAVETGNAGDGPWNGLQKRSIPQWKDYGLKNYVSTTPTSDLTPYWRGFVAIEDNYTAVICTLPYNAQVNASFKIDAAAAGKKIIICSDAYLFYNAGDVGHRFEYITQKGQQEFELPNWLNGHKFYYFIPEGVTLTEAKYRETGFDTEFEGAFTCSDPFFNKLWQKAARTLYINMRDNYMDCPDRERAQWAGDAVHESAEAAYALSPSSHTLTKKWLYELLNWRKPEGSFYAPVPAGNYDQDLPDQSLAAIGQYGLWNYYMNTGDQQMLKDCYDATIRYIINLWERDADGLVLQRYGYAFWGDRTDNKDILLIENCFYYMALKCVQQMAQVLNKKDDYDLYTAKMKLFRDGFNKKFWNGKAYRHPQYTGQTDDRSQALAVVSGIADPAKYPAILDVLQKEEYASTYMEKYVMEALFIMGYGEYALERQKKRFAPMVNSEFSTLWEDWSYINNAYGGSTLNHAWSGGGLIVLSQYLCGIAPIEAGYKTFQVKPQPASITQATAQVSTVAGLIQSSYENKPGMFMLTTLVPAGTVCVAAIKDIYERVTVNGKTVWENGKFFTVPGVTLYKDTDSSYLKFKTQAGNWNFIATSFSQANRNPINVYNVQKKDSILCKGDTLTLSAGTGNNFQWFKNDTLLKNSTHSFLNIWDSGYYYAAKPNITGGFDTARAYHVKFSSLTIPPSPVVQLNSSKALVAFSPGGVGAWQWYRNNLAVAGAVTNLYKPADNAVYTAKITMDGCTSNASDAYLYIGVAVFRIDDIQYINVYPNPVADYMIVSYKLTNLKPVQLSVSAINGTRLIDVAGVNSGDRVSLEGLPHGVYIITIITPEDKKQYSTRIIK